MFSLTCALFEEIFCPSFGMTQEIFHKMEGKNEKLQAF